MGEVHVEDACPSDASRIGKLLRLAFDSRYLLLSIYSSHLGDLHLERSLQEDQQSDSLRVRVVRSGEEILGCTIVSVREERCHLDYVATDPSVVGAGLGSELLRDALARARGRLSLDVFASNHAVRTWYRRRGFSDRYQRVVQVVDLRRVSEATAGGALAREAVALAHESELARGFGEFTVWRGPDAYRFGLLGESTVRLFERPEGETPAAVRIARALLPDRAYLALPTGQEDDELPTYFTDALIRMEMQS